MGLRTSEVTRLEGDHLVGVGFGVLGLTVDFVFMRRHRGGYHGLWEQRRQFGTWNVLYTDSRYKPNKITTEITTLAARDFKYIKKTHTLYPRALSSLGEQGYRSMNLYRSTSKAVSLPSYSSLKAVKRRRSTFRILARSPMLLSNARNRAQTSLKNTKWVGVNKREQTTQRQEMHTTSVKWDITLTFLKINFLRWGRAQTTLWCCYPLRRQVTHKNTLWKQTFDYFFLYIKSRN